MQRKTEQGGWDKTEYQAMEERLTKLSSDAGRLFGYEPELNMVQLTINELLQKVPSLIESTGGEVSFFRDVWPRFFSVLYYYQLMHVYHVKRQRLPKPGRLGLIEGEERRVTEYFEVNEEFWMDFKAKSPNIDIQFRRSSSRDNIVDPLASVIDHDKVTLGGYKVACGLACERYLHFLERERSMLEGKNARAPMEWRESRTAAVQLIKAQAELESIYIDGVPATTAQLRADWEYRFDQKLEDFDRLLYASSSTKKDPAPYFTRLTNAIIGRRQRLQK